MSGLTSSPLRHHFTGRLGDIRGGGFYPAPRRYGVHLALSCPAGLRVALVHALLGVEGRVALDVLPPVPGEAGDHPQLRCWYEASRHGHRGPATAPVLTDRWTGRIVSDHPGHIATDLATHFPGERHLLPAAGQRDRLTALERLFDEDLGRAAARAGEAGAGRGAAQAQERLLAALRGLDELLARQRYVLGERLTLADIHLWTCLVQLDLVHRRHLDAAATRRIAEHPHLWAYARRLLALPEFGARLRVPDILARHDAHCRGREAAGAAVLVIDWRQAAPDPAPAREVGGARRL